MSKLKNISLLLAALFVSCGNDVNPATNDDNSKSFLVSATLVNEIPLQILKSFAQLSGNGDVANLVRYNVRTYKMVYETTYNDVPIRASGLVYVPKDFTSKAPLISLQHGTTFVKDDAPSVDGGFTGLEFFASAGYIAMMPDYIGYGESREIFHPYYDHEHSASCVIDMIKSTREFLNNANLSHSDQLFLAGYSEGGYVTLSAAKELEMNSAHNLTVTAVAAGAGGYDLEEMLHQVTLQEHYSYPSYLAFVIMSYNTTYGWNRPLSYFFNAPYAEALAIYMNGDYSGSQINAQLTTEVNALFNPDFFGRLKTTEGEPELKAALEKNSVSGWSTNIPMRLYHGTKDEIIPYTNSELTLKNFQDAGSDNVSLTLIPEGTHGNSFAPMLLDFVPWFESLRE